MNQGDEQLLKLIAAGDPNALGILFSKHLPKLKRLVVARIDPRIAARVDESDVMQEVHVEVMRRMPGSTRTASQQKLDRQLFGAPRRVSYRQNQ